MANGWISLHRSIQDHWIYEKRTFSKFEAWVDLLMMANHKDNTFLLGNELIETKRGQFITSELKLMERWGWSKTKVRSFLELLEKDSMIVKISDKKKTTLTICNYCVYQDSKTTEEPQKNHRETTKEPQKDTNNNVNNVNNEKKKDIHERFDEFWRVYPRKVAKDKAVTSFKNHVKNNEVDIVIADVVRRSKSDDWKKDNGKYIPHPTTYLNQRRWEEEINIPASKSSNIEMIQTPIPRRRDDI